MTNILNLEGSEVTLQPCMKAYTFEVTTVPSQGSKTTLACVICTCAYIGKETLLQANQGAVVKLKCIAELVLQNNQAFLIDVETKDFDHKEDKPQEQTEIIESSVDTGLPCDTLETSTNETNS
jgi:hypothetical protein